MQLFCFSRLFQVHKGVTRACFLYPSPSPSRPPYLTLSLSLCRAPSLAPLFSLTLLFLSPYISPTLSLSFEKDKQMVVIFINIYYIRIMVMKMADSSSCIVIRPLRPLGKTHAPPWHYMDTWFRDQISQAISWLLSPAISHLYPRNHGHEKKKPIQSTALKH